VAVPHRYLLGWNGVSPLDLGMKVEGYTHLVIE
jgi:hypothetical protein